MGIVNVLHLLFVGTGDYSYLHPVIPKIGDKSFHTGNVFIRHAFLEDIEPGCNLLLSLQLIREVFVVNLGQRLSLDTASEVLFIQIFTPLFIPENSVLRFRIHDDTIEIKQCRNCLCCIHTYSFFLPKTLNLVY